MAYDARIILGGQQPDIIGEMGRGNALAGQVMDMRRTRELQDLYRSQGAGILAGEQGALNALASFDPSAAMAARGANQDFEFAGRRMAMQEEELKIAQENARLRGAEFAATLSAQERAATAAEVDKALAMATQAQTPEQWDAIMQGLGEAGAEYVGQFENRDMIIAGAMGLSEALKMNEPVDPTKGAPNGFYFNEPGNPAAGVSRLPGFEEKPSDDYERYVAEEKAAGRQPLSRIDYAQAIKGNGVSMTMPDGTVVRVGGKGQDAGGVDASSADYMLNTIDGILNDPALDWATGWLEWTQNIPGTGSKRFATRANQLEGQAFLQAFESLRGGGQITEIEGQKATQAIGRLDTAQSAEDYRNALTELRDILVAAKARPPGWAEGQPTDAQTVPKTPSVGDVMDGYRYKGGDPSQQSSWEAVQ